MQCLPHCDDLSCGHAPQLCSDASQLCSFSPFMVAGSRFRITRLRLACNQGNHALCGQLTDTDSNYVCYHVLYWVLQSLQCGVALLCKYCPLYLHVCVQCGCKYSLITESYHQRSSPLSFVGNKPDSISLGRNIKKILIFIFGHKMILSAVL